MILKFLVLVTGNYLLIVLVVLFGVLIATAACYYYRRKPSLLPDALSDSAGGLLAPKPVDSASLQTPRTQETGLRMSVFNGSSTSSYDRSHITGWFFIRMDFKIEFKVKKENLLSK